MAGANQKVVSAVGLLSSSVLICTGAVANENEFSRHIKRGKLKTTIFHGTNRAKYAEKIDKCDVVFTTYQTLRSDYSADQCLYSKPWTRVVLDEGESWFQDFG